MRPAKASGIVTGDATVSYWTIFSLGPSNIPRSLCESKSTQFLSRFLSGESPQPPCDKKRPLQRKGHAEWRLALKVITTKKIQNIHQVNQARLIHKSICRLIAIYNKFFSFTLLLLLVLNSSGLLKFFFSLMLIYIWFPVYQRSTTYKTRPTNFKRKDYPFPITSGRGKRKSIRSRALTQALHLIWGNIIQFLKPSSLCIPAGVNGWFWRERPGGPHYFRSCLPPSPEKGKDCMIAIGPPNLHKDLNPPISVGCKRQYTLFKSILNIVITY